MYMEQDVYFMYCCAADHILVVMDILKFLIRID